MPFNNNDHIWMQRALNLARKGEGYVSPNPMVGCVIVSEQGKVIGEGYHERYGKAHAEVNAVRSVNEENDLDGATVYVTLEPCSHQGKTPPCSDMLANLPIKRVVVAMKDPNSEVNGKGIEQIRSAGIEVEVGLLQEEAERLNEFFIHYHRFGKPFVTLKIAQTADGYIAAPNGDSKWITGKHARTQVHKWRSRYDAVMVGRNTVKVDNPSLTVRLHEGHQPYRVVIDGPFSLPRHLNLFSDQYEEKTIVVTYNREKAGEEADPMLKMMKSNYFRGEVVLVPEKKGHTDLSAAITALSDKGITSLFVEGGQQLSTALLKEGLVDKIELFVSPKILGGGTRSILGLGINRMEEIIELKSAEWSMHGHDMLLTAYLP